MTIYKVRSSDSNLLVWKALIDEIVGTQVLAASLRDSGTTKKLAVIIPADEAHRLLPQTIAQLEVRQYQVDILMSIAII